MLPQLDLLVNLDGDLLAQALVRSNPDRGVSPLAHNLANCVLLLELGSEVLLLPLEHLVNGILIEFVENGKSVEKSVGFVIDFQEFNRIGKILDRFMFFPILVDMLLCFIFGFRAVEKQVDILLGHNIFFIGFGKRVLLVGFIEFSRTILPQPVGVNRPQNVGDVAR